MAMMAERVRGHPENWRLGRTVRTSVGTIKDYYRDFLEKTESLHAVILTALAYNMRE